MPKRPGIHRSTWCGALLIALALPATCRAQPAPPLRLSLRPVVDMLRSNAPMLFDARLTWNSSRLLEGRLVLDLYVGRQQVASLRSRDVVLAEGQTILPVMFPPAVLADESVVCTAQARFESLEGVIDLGNHDLAPPVERRRVLVAGIVIPDGSTSPPAGVTVPDEEPFALQESLRFETRLARQDFLRDVMCRVVEVWPETLPESGLELAAFDVLIVTRDGLDDLRTAQLAAIAEWVEAGGSACVMVDRLRDREDQALVQRIAGGSEIDPVMAFDDKGQAELLRAGPAGWRRGAPGIGRSVVAVAPIDVAGADWRREIGYLWGIRAARTQALLAPPVDAAAMAEVNENAYLNAALMPYLPKALDGEVQLPQLLMPEKVEGVPFRTVAALLGACLFAVAPLEYFVLGWLRRRRWTWLVFPCVAVGFTLFMMRVAQSHIGDADHATSLTFVDLAADGRVVRQSRFELDFTVTERRLETPVERQFVVALDTRPWVTQLDDPYAMRPPRYAQTPSLIDAAQQPFAYAGRPPIRYTLTRPMRQWSPRMARWTSFAGEAGQPAPLGVDWAALTGESLRDDAAAAAFAAQLQDRTPSVQVLVAAGTRAKWYPSGGAALDSDPRFNSIAALVHAASIREEEGLFRIVAQRSPTCGGDMEDLALLDIGDRRQTLLVVLVADGEGSYTAYRRIFREDG